MYRPMYHATSVMISFSFLLCSYSTDFPCSFRSILKQISDTLLAFPGSANGKEPACHSRRCKRRRFDHWVRKILWRRAWQPTPIFLPEDSHGQRSLVGYSPRGCKESDTTEQLSMPADTMAFHL